MTILSCNCDVEKACDMHADEIYNPEGAEMSNNHVHQNFREILNSMLEESKTNPFMHKAVHTLYGESVFEGSSDPEIRALARIDSREVYRDE